MKAVILAAGVGKRLKPLTAKKPKALIRVDGIPLIEHQILAYMKAGLSPNMIYVVSGYKHKKMIKFLTAKYPGINVVKNDDYRTTNNMYSLYLALLRMKLEKRDECLFISNGDCIYDFQIIEHLCTVDTNLIACDSSVYNQESMKIAVRDGRITNIAKNLLKKQSYAVSVDLYKFEFEAVEKLRAIIEDYVFEKQQLRLWTEIAINDLLQVDRIKPLDIKGFSWAEIDDINDLVLADKLFSKIDLKSKKCFVVDLDGTMYLGKTPVKGTIKFVNQHIHEKDFYFITNNTSRLPEDYVDILQKIGIETDVEKIITPINSLIWYLRRKNIAKVYLLANSRLTDYLSKQIREIRFTCDIEECEAVIVAYDTELTYEKIKTASLMLQQNKRVEFLVTHSDVVRPIENGNTPDIGCTILTLQKTTKRAPTKDFGKPNPFLLAGVRDKYSVSEIVVVGDRIYTDKKMADNIRCDFICVLSGETSRNDVENLGDGEFPSLIVEDLGLLLD